ncbi:ParB/RepB/Spo0J family partition protein [Actinomadura fibrosa]|uniref:ParB N-terminal domain-containing protein n=1 Tax=Actinomadura fibrosa TaxID=111802 RepID=A0ABW2XW35_9ACTN|nr:ParB N-terminal domain-containing protein [Actinomadura fibrosa]
MNTTVRQPISRESALARRLSSQQEDIERSAVARVPIASLATTGSPRLAGEDAEHVRTLAESGAELPPIVVHMPSRRVIDGMHRLRAAVLRGETEIAARFFHGTEEDAFPLAVAANIRHGLPLSREDRMAAAERIFATHPEWSDRMVALVVGLSGVKVAALRRRVAGHIPQPAVRIGRDGRCRPVDGAAGRERAARLFESDPGASLRKIAREAGISPSTAADVRDRIRRGEDPVRTRSAARTGSGPAKVPASAIPELLTGFERLRRDPSLRFTEAGRTLLRMFDACLAVARDEEAIRKGLPPHCLAPMAELSQASAAVLRSFADGLQHQESARSAADGG